MLPFIRRYVTNYLPQVGYVLISIHVCLLAGLPKTTRMICTEYDGNEAQEPQKKLLDFGGNPD